MPNRKLLQNRIEIYLRHFIDRFTAFADTAQLPENRELLAGTFLYLLDENDLVPDQIPNIGLLDDLMVFLAVTRKLLPEKGHQHPIFSANELEEIVVLIEKNKGLLFTQFDTSVECIKQKGREAVGRLKELTQQIIQKYSNLGKDQK